LHHVDDRIGSTIGLDGEVCSHCGFIDSRRIVGNTARRTFVEPP
jgi:hypothetical protein